MGLDHSTKVDLRMRQAYSPGNAAATGVLSGGHQFSVGRRDSDKNEQYLQVTQAEAEQVFLNDPILVANDPDRSTALTEDHFPSAPGQSGGGLEAPGHQARRPVSVPAESSPGRAGGVRASGGGRRGDA